MSKKKTIKPIHIYNKTYRHNYYVYYGVPLKEYLEHFEIQSGFPEEIGLDATCGGRCSTISDEEYGFMTFIWTKEKDIPSLVHEIFHAVYETLNGRGIPLTESSEEAYAYLSEMIMREVV